MHMHHICTRMYFTFECPTTVTLPIVLQQVVKGLQLHYGKGDTGLKKIPTQEASVKSTN